jgi:uncharacterized protein YdaU (DUF1376 family)
MSALPYIPLYVADYLADTSHLSTLEHGAYLLLIMNYWQRGKPLPANDVSLSRICRLSIDEWDAAKDQIAPLFTTTETEWQHKRIEAELEHVRNRTEAKVKAGKASAKAKSKHKTNTPPTEINTRSTPVEQMPNNTDTDTDIDRGDKSPLRRGDGFSEFWEAYPARDGNSDIQAAKMAYYAVIIETPPDLLIAAAGAYATWCNENHKSGTQYVKQAKTWLASGLWREWESKAIAAVPAGVLVKRGSPAWDAWQAIKKTPCSERHDGWFFPTEWPLGQPIETPLMKRAVS